MCIKAGNINNPGEQKSKDVFMEVTLFQQFEDLNYLHYLRNKIQYVMETSAHYLFKFLFLWPILFAEIETFHPP